MATPGETGNKGNYMRKIMIALPCLLVAGVAMAKEAPRADVLQGADRVLMTSSFHAADTNDAPVIRAGERQLEAAKRKGTAKAATAPAPKPVEAPTDPSKRFHMTQNGKQMTADDFDAWMKKNGYRVATGAPSQPKAEEPAKKGTK